MVKKSESASNSSHLNPSLRLYDYWLLENPEHLNYKPDDHGFNSGWENSDFFPECVY